MKKILTIVVIVLLLAFGFYSIYKDKGGKSTPNPLENSTKTSYYDEGVISFYYNSFFTARAEDNTPTSDWKLNAKQKGIILASVSVPREYMPSTNFSGAKLTVGRSADVNAIKSCTTADMPMKEITNYTVNVGGYPFTKILSSDAGAGNFYETTSYRGIVDGDCYVVEYTIHSTNIGNYSPDQGIKEFDKNMIVTDMENIVKSIKFLVNSD
ncbi:MAG: hypothetical protein V4504_00775 [Patescibacteria group bacterium]